MTEEKKPNCYECRWRGHVAGSAHSQCRHPYNRALIENGMLQLFGVFASVGRMELPPMSDKRLKIKANEVGIRRGWFHFPFNFDPTWLDSCDGFEKIKEDEPRITNKHLAEDTYGDAPNCEKPYFCEECPLRFKCFTERGESEKRKDN